MDRIRSGCNAATASMFTESIEATTFGAEVPTASFAHGPIPPATSEYHSATPTGWTPSARAKSWSRRPTVTTLCGAAGITAVPILPVTVTGNVSVADPPGAAGALGAAG